MSASGPEQQKVGFSIDAFIVPHPVSHLKSLREKSDRESLYQAIVVGGSFIEGYGMLWFKKTLDNKGLEFHWKDDFPPIEMRHVLALLNGARLIDDNEYGRFLQAAQYRNKVVHRMFSQWSEEQKELERMTDLMIECVTTILTKYGRQPVE